MRGVPRVEAAVELTLNTSKEVKDSMKAAACAKGLSNPPPPAVVDSSAVCAMICLWSGSGSEEGYDRV